MAARYFLRLDDASPFWRRSEWEWWVEQCDQLRAPGLICVIPDNKNERLMQAGRDPDFWEAARVLQRNGWGIALHGLTHESATSSRGIYGTVRRSEFAGLPVPIQLEKIERGYRILGDHGLEADAFVAPWHSLDRGTVKALSAFGKIPYLVEGYAWAPYQRWSLRWIPCQLWKPQRRPSGLFGVCVHPDTATKKDRNRLRQSAAAAWPFVGWRSAVTSIDEWRDYGLSIVAEEKLERSLMRLRATAGAFKLALFGSD